MTLICIRAMDAMMNDDALWLETRVKETLPVRVRCTENGILPVREQGEGQDAWMTRLASVVGASDPVIAKYTLHALAAGIRPGDSTRLNALLAEMQTLAPTDAIERALIIQMLLVSSSAVEAMTKAGRAPSMDAQIAISNAAIRLMRLFIQQGDALRRYRSQGTQSVTVTNITADQAIVGNVYGGENKN